MAYAFPMILGLIETEQEGAMRPVETVLYGLVISVIFAALFNVMAALL